MSYVAAIDVGGTFTDLVLIDDAGATTVVKTPTTPDSTDGVLKGIGEGLVAVGAPPEDLRAIVYGTTAAVNALLTRRGARVGLLVTEGFGQILHLARSRTPGPLVGWLAMVKPDPLADLELTCEIPERTTAAGTIETPLDELAVRTALERLVAKGAETIAVVYLHSYANAENERRTRELAAEVVPGVEVTLSSDILPEYREYERAETTVANAYVLPSVARALTEFEERAAGEGYNCSISIVRSDGGLTSMAGAAARPVDTIFSGPSGGVAGALAVASAIGCDNILTLDMGGTSTDVAVCTGQVPPVARETIVGELPIRAPSVDVRSIGAGGGSIAQMPLLLRGLRVGPESAGAWPGPACYGRGGEKPTVTDANLVLGRLPDWLLGGSMTLDRSAALAAVTRLAETLDMDPLALAQGIVDLVDEQMTGALRLMSVERGLDPRAFALVAFGGAGPLHANSLAANLGCFPVIIPPLPGVLSAYGFHTVGPRATFTRTCIGHVDSQQVQLAQRELTAAAASWLEQEGISNGALLLSCDVRFFRQGYELEISFAEGELESVPDRFRAEHDRLYGFVPEAEIEIVNLRVEAKGGSSLAARPIDDLVEGDGAQALVGTQDVWLGSEWRQTGVFERGTLRAGDRLVGPAIVTQPDTTTLVLPGSFAAVDGHGNLVIEEVS